ncbi:hypothetical protein [Priestia megaterium]|uniref:hypothetical protein n=1 Tax=Priestia megaterium TaxID=1404 RepID=UPI003A8071AB
MLSEVFIQEIYDLLNDYEFRSSDFSVVCDQSDNQSFVVLTIQYRYKKEFFIKARIIRSKFDNVRISPGEVMAIEVKTGLTKAEFTRVIPSWLGSMNEYFSNASVARKVFKNQQRIDELEEKLNEAIGDLDLDEEFRDDEINILKERLDKMEKELTEKLNQEIQDKQVLTEKLNELHTDVENLKRQVGPLNKKNWLLSYYTKLYLWNQSNPSLLPKSLLHLGYKFLPESVQNVLPSDIIDSTVDAFLPESTIAKKDTVKQDK